MCLENCRWLRGVVIALAIVLLLWSAQGTYGQSAAFATITGRALDPKGAAVLNADVTATNTETGITRTTKTTSDGLYRFDNLPPGIYNVAIEVGGFNKSEAKAVKLQVGEQRDVNFTLELAGQKQSVVVTSELPLIETTKTDTSVVIDDKAVADLPTTTAFQGIGGISNDYEGLATSAPGVRYDYTGLSFDIVGPGAINSRGITVNLDGGNISDQVVSSRDALGASVEEVKEFQVLENNYNAEYGQAGNVILNVITKSGTNAVHGDAHAYFRGRNLGASDFFYNQTACDPTLTSGGGSCDNKTDAGFPDSRAPFFKHEEGFTAGGPFVKDRLFWFTSLERAAQALPETLTPFGTSITTSSPTTELLWSGKVDAKLTDKHMLTVRYNVQRDITANVIVQTGPAIDPSSLTSFVAHDNVLNIGMVSTLTPHTVNEARFVWHRFLSLTADVSTLPEYHLPAAYLGADFCCPQGAFQQRFQYIDNFSWSHGTHTMKAGMNISHFPYQSVFQQYHFGQYASFSAGGCTNSNFPSANGQCPSQFTTGAGPGFVGAFDTIYGAYIQDTWQFRPTIVVNYGLRYDYEDGAFRGGTIPGNNGSCFQSNGLIPACGQDKNNWQPRLGVAWSPNYSSGMLHKLFGNSGKSVIRASGAVVTEMAYLNVALDSLNFDGKNLNTATISYPALQVTGGNQTGCFLPSGAVNPNPGNPQACAVLAAYPNAPNPNSLVPFTGGGSGGFGRIRPISPTIKNPNVYMGALTLQRQIGSSFTFSVGYQGVFGHGLFGETDTNLNQPVADPNHPGFFYMPATGGNDRPNPLFGAIRTNFSNRDSSYNSLVLTAQKRLSHHFEIQGSYIFSKTLGDGEDFFGLSEPANPFASLGLDRAVSQQDIRHLANFSFVADTNNLIGTPFVKQVVNNWTFSILGSLQSGRPYPVSTGDGVFSGSAFAALGNETNQRPNVCAAGSTIIGCAGAPAGALVSTNIGSIGQTNLTIGPAGVSACQAAGLSNCAALQTTFAPPINPSTGQSLASGNGPLDTYAGTPVDFQFFSGNLGRNAGLSQGLTRFDISLMKAFKIPNWESSSVELKLDVFNVFNHPLFIGNDSNDALNFILPPSLTASGGGPNPDFNCTSLCVNPFTGLYLGRNGQPLTLQDFRLGRVDQNLNPNVTNFKGLGNPAADVTPRIMQLGIRFRW